MRTLSLTDMRANLRAVMDRVVQDRAPVMITRQAAEAVVMVSAGEWASIEETLYLLQSPANRERLVRSIEQLTIATGEAPEAIEP
ncbi:MAG: type toxin-antitoxin system prevent-host-death family antitoxin [Sphingomonas bacterium]|jgi:antitoxin YefM|uniref:type II toxin-antitoxin system Phd/YefM family antitoxin n=1 Tax=Sphingomonas bacterium TaxID=1895847 RepID=UPI00262B61EF|nr:type II toxin-antitoxin system prevent-host-death family antitoxin [Sphingomonas bacterium]MDB5706238.1 type toxin-antitoxin system prevent-host-death family antitoxin [Sphingomonas bacterium]